MSLGILKSFITSWFISLETSLEYKVSREQFSHILRATKKDIGEHAVIAVEDLVKILDLKKMHLYHYNFVGKTTLGFKGDSIVEASFSATKRKSNQISTRKTIDKSAMNMVKDTIASSRLKQNLMQQQVEREVCWSRARVKNDLTKYALGLFCKNFDKKMNYFTCRVGEKEWLSMSIDEFTKQKSKMDAPHFKRVRTIVLDNDGFLNCSCGKTGEYLLPCKHICSLVNDESYFSIDMFHIRWHKQFSLFYGKEAGKQCSPNQSKLLNEFFDSTRNNHYDSNGLYKGVPMKGSTFLRELSEYNGFDEACEKIKFMLFVKKQSNLVPVQSTSLSLEEYRMKKTQTSTNIDCDVLGEFSFLSQEEFQESDMYMLPNKKICHKSDDRSPYHQVIDGFEKTLDMAKTQEDIDEINMFFGNFVNKKVAEKRRHNLHLGTTVIFGENLKIGAQIEKRHKFLHEKI